MATQIGSQNILYPPVPPSLDEERTIMVKKKKYAMKFPA